MSSNIQILLASLSPTRNALGALFRLGARLVKGRYANCGSLDQTLMLLDRFYCAFCQTVNFCVSGKSRLFVRIESGGLSLKSIKWRPRVSRGGATYPRIHAARAA